jgi:hypothetical protein
VFDDAALPAHKRGMIVGTLVATVRKALKSIEIELALKGGKLGLTKESAETTKKKV